MEANTDQIPGAAPAQRGDSEAAFQQFDSYPWARDRSFLVSRHSCLGRLVSSPATPLTTDQQGLMATLGPSLINNTTDGFTRQKALSTTLQARIWWYRSRFNTDIDRTLYESYSAFHQQSCPDGVILTKLEEIQQRMNGAAPGPAPSSGQNIPAWQLNAPKVDLSKKADDGANHSNTGDGAPYPENFQALIEAVTTGKPIPGIKEIPDTVVRPPVSFTVKQTPRYLIVKFSFDL